MDISKFYKKSCCLLLCSISTTAFAWWDQAHQMIGLVASQNITPETYEKSKKLLDFIVTNPGSKQLSINTSNFDTASSWADIINLHPNDSIIIAHKLCHYTDIPMDASQSGTHISYDEAYKKLQHVLTEKENNSLSCLKGTIKTLTLSSTTQQQKAIALRFLMHIAQDIGQPLHNISKFKDHDSDRGGNGTEFENTVWIPTTNGTSSSQKKLHAVWDATLGSYIQFPYKPSQSKYGIFDPADLEVNELLAKTLQANPHFQDKLYKTATAKQNIEDWIIDGFQVAAKHAYANLDESWGTYSVNRYAIVNDQVIKSSVRLAHLLNAIFDPENSQTEFNTLVTEIYKDRKIKPFVLQ